MFRVLTTDRAEFGINLPPRQIAAECVSGMRYRKQLVVNDRYDEHLTRLSEKGQGVAHCTNCRACSVPCNDNPVFCEHRGVWWHEDNWPTTRKQGGLDQFFARRIKWSAHIDHQDVVHLGAMDHSFAKRDGLIFGLQNVT